MEEVFGGNGPRIRLIRTRLVNDTQFGEPIRT